MHILLIVPPNPHRAYTYLQNGPLVLAAQVATARRDVMVVYRDLNLERHIDYAEVDAADIIGITVMGTPYIPAALEISKRLRMNGYTRPIVIGGQGVMRLTSTQFRGIYRGLGDVRQVATHLDTEQAFNLRLASGINTSLDTTLMGIVSAEHTARYLANEWCLYTGDGCKYNCRFCAATKAHAEQFRSVQALQRDVSIIAMTSGAMGMSSTSAYLSSLDIMQNPAQMEERLFAAQATSSRCGVVLRMRGLATAQSIVEAVQEDANILNRWRDYGVHTIGLGVDGNDPDVWKAQNKRHNTHAGIRAAFDAIMDAGVTAEALMVIGFRGDTWESTRANVRAMFSLASEGIVVRPYLGKEGAPGSETWKKDLDLVEQMVRDPRLFRLLDYPMLGSKFTHPNPKQRAMVNAAFLGSVVGLKMLHGCPTNPVFPAVGGPVTHRAAARLANWAMPPDK